MQPKINTYTFRASVIYELTIDAQNEDEAFELMELSPWLKAWQELPEAEIWINDVTEAGPDHVDH
jgi:hypothetical protein